MKPLVLWELGVAIRESGLDHLSLSKKAGVEASDIDRVLAEDPGVPVGVAEHLAKVLNLRLGLEPVAPPHLESDGAKKALEKQLLALADSFAYAGAQRQEAAHLLTVRPILQAIYTTPDTLFNVDYWYRMNFGGGGDDRETNLSFSSDGRRMSCVRDGLKFRKEPLSKKAPMTARQWVFEAERTRVVVLLCRPKEAAITQIAITLLPMEGGPGRAKPWAEQKSVPLAEE